MMALLDKALRLNPRTRMPYADPRESPSSLWQPGQKYIWQRAIYTVPSDVSEERIQFDAPKYRNRGGEAYEKQGFRVLAVDGPHLDTSMVARNLVPPDRKQYEIWYKLVRAPQEVKVDVPDRLVPKLQKAGLTLVG